MKKDFASQRTTYVVPYNVELAERILQQISHEAELLQAIPVILKIRSPLQYLQCSRWFGPERQDEVNLFSQFRIEFVKEFITKIGLGCPQVLNTRCYLAENLIRRFKVSTNEFSQPIISHRVSFGIKAADHPSDVNAVSPITFRGESEIRVL